MHGARELAWHYLKPRVREKDVVDLCCGDRWLEAKCQELPGPARPKSYRGFDLKEGWSALLPACWDEVAWFDLAVTVYGFQHLMGLEAEAWLQLRKVLGNARFVYVGRHIGRHSDRELQRADPLNGYNLQGLMGLALATGFEVVDFKTYCYVETAFRDADEVEANAFAATLRSR